MKCWGIRIYLTKSRFSLNGGYIVYMEVLSGHEKIITKSGISLDAGTLNRGFTVCVWEMHLKTVGSDPTSSTDVYATASLLYNVHDHCYGKHFARWQGWGTLKWTELWSDVLRATQLLIPTACDMGKCDFTTTFRSPGFTTLHLQHAIWYQVTVQVHNTMED